MLYLPYNINDTIMTIVHRERWFFYSCGGKRMRILSVTSQKPNSTGSGVYLSELVKGFQDMGCEQAVIAGVYRDDSVSFPAGVTFYPVYFQSKDLPFPIVGMSDEMPYESTVYCEMTQSMVEQFKNAFAISIREAVLRFQPDIILCHHLYIVTAIVRQECPTIPVYGCCHGTDIRQMKKHTLEAGYIKEQIQKLDVILALQEEQKKTIKEVYGVEATKIQVIGSGYNNRIFYDQQLRNTQKKAKGKKNLIFAGKLSEKKGVLSLLRCLEYLPYKSDELTLWLAGGYGNQQEYDMICSMVQSCRYSVQLLGNVDQNELARRFNQCDVFVLPSLYEGLPLVILEALACGLQVVCTNLLGIKDWMDAHIPNNQIYYVQPPHMRNTDEPEPKELPEFEKHLALALEECLERDTEQSIDVTELSWKKVCEKIEHYMNS